MGDDAAKAQSQIEQLKGQLEVLRRHHEATTSLMTTLIVSDDLPHQVLRRHHEATTVEQRMQMDVLQQLREDEAKETRDRLEALARAKRQQASRFTEQLRGRNSECMLMASLIRRADSVSSCVQSMRIERPTRTICMLRSSGCARCTRRRSPRAR